jgi:mono/diheme cytochrome c family protein
MDVLPADLVSNIRAGRVNLDDPATTLALLKLNAVVGVKGFFTPDGSRLRAVGVTCAICHSTVDDAFAPGIGHRLDGWPNSDLNIGAIISSAPDLSPFATLLKVDQPTVRKVLTSWGPGKFDAELPLDGKAFRPDGKSAATLIPPAYGQAGVNLITWTGWGTVTYWNAFVANLEMHGKGTFFDSRLDDAKKFPVAARNRMGHKRDAVDLITPKLAALHTYQLTLPAPAPPAGSFDRAAAARGKVVFNGKGTCARCHVPPLTTEPGWNMHKPSEIGIDAFQANRSPDGRYRTPSLNGIWSRQKRGFYHDGRFKTLGDVVNHYNTFLKLQLTQQERNDLVQYMLSLPEPGANQ